MLIRQYGELKNASSTVNIINSQKDGNETKFLSLCPGFEPSLIRCNYYPIHVRSAPGHFVGFPSMIGNK